MGTKAITLFEKPKEKGEPWGKWNKGSETERGGVGDNCHSGGRRARTLQEADS